MLLQRSHGDIGGLHSATVVLQFEFRVYLPVQALSDVQEALDVIPCDRFRRGQIYLSLESAGHYLDKPGVETGDEGGLVDGLDEVDEAELILVRLAGPLLREKVQELAQRVRIHWHRQGQRAITGDQASERVLVPRHSDDLPNDVAGVLDGEQVTSAAAADLLARGDDHIIVDTSPKLLQLLGVYDVQRGLKAKLRLNGVIVQEHVAESKGHAPETAANSSEDDRATGLIEDLRHKTTGRVTHEGKPGGRVGRPWQDVQARVHAEIGPCGDLLQRVDFLQGTVEVAPLAQEYHSKMHLRGRHRPSIAETANRRCT